jgi:hypothetical protein
LDLFTKLLACKDTKTITIVLEALKNILKIGAEHYSKNGENAFQLLFEEIDGIALLEKL